MAVMEKSNSVGELVQLIQENISNNDVQIGLYSIAVTSLAVALRRTRPFSRFSRPSDIPKHFIKARTKLCGTVERVEPSGALLMVQHKPLFRILRTKIDNLPVRISGVTVNGNGINWLQSVVSGNEVNFVPVLKHGNSVECEVTMEQKTKDKKTRTVHIGPSLVSIGFGKVQPVEKSLANNGFHLVYYKNLKNAERLAEKKRLGNWYYLKITQETSLQIARLLLSGAASFFKPKIVKVAEKPLKLVEKPKNVLPEDSRVAPA